ncbi:hypothetical protein D3C81_2027780 [compost metagenome]
MFGGFCVFALVQCPDDHPERLGEGREVRQPHAAQLPFEQLAKGTQGTVDGAYGMQLRVVAAGQVLA